MKKKKRKKMNSSIIGQILYILFMIVAFGLTLTGTLTPGWRYVGNLDEKYQQYIPNGLFPTLCFNNGNETDLKETCINWLKAQPLWNEIIIGGLLIAATIEFFSILWALIGFCSCRCCKECFHFALPGLSTAASLFLLTILILFGIHNPHAIEDFSKAYNIKLFQPEEDITNEISYSYYITVGSLIFNFIGIGIGIFISLWNHETKRLFRYRNPTLPLQYYPKEISVNKKSIN